MRNTSTKFTSIAGRPGRAIILGVAVMAVGAVTMSTASAAVTPFGPEVVAAGACGLGGGEATTAPDGSFRGFAECDWTNAPIRFFSRTAAGVENPSETSGFRGKVLGVTADTTATYVLFRTATTISIGKRTNAGAYSSRAIDTWNG